MLWLTVRQLKSSESGQRIAAAARLGESGKAAAVEPLVAALGDAVSAVRVAVISALGKLGDASAVGALLLFRSDADHQVRAAVVEALGEIGGPRVLEPIIAGLSDGHCDVRAASVRAAGRVADTRAVASLAALIRERRPRHNLATAVEAVTALQKIGGQQAIDALARTLPDKDEEVRGAAAAALTSLGWNPSNETERALFAVAGRRWVIAANCGDSAVGALLNAAEHCSTSGQDPLMAHICAALRSIGSSAAAPTGSVILVKAPEVYIGNADRYRPLVQVLGQIGGSAAVKPLLAAARNGFLAGNAYAALQGLLARPSISGIPEADLRTVADELPDVLNTQDFDEDGTYYQGSLAGSYLKGLAHKELGRRGDRAACERWVTIVLGTAGVDRQVQALAAALRHEREDVREAAAFTLGGIAVPEVAGPLAEVLSDEVADVRHAAADALARIGPPAIEALALALAHEYKRTRIAAIRTLRGMDDARVPGLLSRAVEDSSKDVREAAARALESWGGTRPG